MESTFQAVADYEESLFTAMYTEETSFTATHAKHTLPPKTFYPHHPGSVS
jgi:hypothetical protein